MQGEAYVVMNSCFCLCAFLLGGKMAGFSIPSPTRLMISSISGGLCALACALFPSPLWLILPPIQLRFCYGKRSAAQLLRAYVTVCACLILSAGSVTLLLRGGAGKTWTFTIAIGGQLLLWQLCRLMPSRAESIRQLELSWNNKSITLPAMLDSGNLLRDPITGLCVIVAPLQAAARMEPTLILWYQRQELPRGFRLLRVRTAAGSCLMPLFRPERCYLYVDGVKRSVNVMVAVAGTDYNGFQALVPSRALKNIALDTAPCCTATVY